jgi:class 3 adenylate cyclase
MHRRGAFGYDEREAVLAGSQLAELARAGEVLVSRTVKDLVARSGISFTDRGTHQLPEIADPWPVFAVSDVPVG